MCGGIIVNFLEKSEREQHFNKRYCRFWCDKLSNLSRVLITQQPKVFNEIIKLWCVLTWLSRSKWKLWPTLDLGCISSKCPTVCTIYCKLQCLILISPRFRLCLWNRTFCCWQQSFQDLSNYPAHMLSTCKGGGHFLGNGGTWGSSPPSVLAINCWWAGWASWW